MKRSTPIALRLISKSLWKTHVNVLNYCFSISFLISAGLDILVWFRRFCFLKKYLNFIPIYTYSFINFNMLYIYFRYFCIKKIIYYYISQNTKLFSRKFLLIKSFRNVKRLNTLTFRRVKTYSHLFLFRFFQKMETLIWTKYNIMCKIFPLNLFDFVFTEPFLRNSLLIQHFTKLKIRDFKFLIFLTIFCIYFKDAFLFTKIFIKWLRHTKRHNIFLKNYLTILHVIFKCIPSLDSLIFRLSGRWDSRDRAYNRTFVFGKNIKLQKFSDNIIYHQQDIQTRIGSFGLKVWMQ